jgi:pimeloyl-ACP methyl ester carboxylesterase
MDIETRTRSNPRQFPESPKVQRQDHTFKGPDGDFHYIDWGGNGSLTHFSHATGLCAGLYSPLTEKLRHRLHVIGMDDRGHGQTKAPAIPRKLKNWDIFARDLERFLEKAGEPAVAIGHSRGGVVSLLLAIKRPDLIRALILIDPTILPPSWMWKWHLAKSIGIAKYVPIAARAAKRKREWPDTKTILKAYQGKGMFKTWKEGFLEAYIADGVEPTGRGTVRLSCDPVWESRCFATCPHDVWKLIPRLQQPTLILYGSESDTFLEEAADRFKRDVPRAILKPFKNTGHFVPMERPDETARAVFSFLEKIDIF